ncbi:Rho GTPase activating protein [Entamoeba marina]
MNYSSSIDIRGGQFKKFTKVLLELKNDTLKVLTADGVKERITITTNAAMFHKRLTWLKKLPENVHEFTFEILYDKLYQVTCSSSNDYFTWLSILPCLMKCNEIFGVPLTVGVAKSGWRYPLPVYRCIEYLETHDAINVEGIFQLLDGGQDITPQNIDDVHIATSIIKMYLPGTSPNIPQAIKGVLSRLPEENKNTLWFLMRYLNTVTKFTETNQMTSKNLAVCFAPAIFRSPIDDAAREVQDAPVVRTVTESMITNFNLIFNEVEKVNLAKSMAYPSYPAIIPVSSISQAIISDAFQRRFAATTDDIEDTTSFNTDDNSPPQWLSSKQSSNHFNKQQKHSSVYGLSNVSAPQPTSTPPKFVMGNRQNNSPQSTVTPPKFVMGSHQKETSPRTSQKLVIGTQKEITSPRNSQPKFVMGNHPQDHQIHNDIEEKVKPTTSPIEPVNSTKVVIGGRKEGTTQNKVVNESGLQPESKSNEVKPPRKSFFTMKTMKKNTQFYMPQDPNIVQLVQPVSFDSLGSSNEKVSLLSKTVLEQDQTIHLLKQKLFELGLNDQDFKQIISSQLPVDVSKISSNSSSPKQSISTPSSAKPEDRSSARNTNFLQRTRQVVLPNDNESIQ